MNSLRVSFARPLVLAALVGTASLPCSAQLTGGSVAAWGAGTFITNTAPNYGQSIVPPAASNIIAIAAGPYHSLALRKDGKILAWGQPGSVTSVPPSITNVVAIAAGHNHNLALQSNGMVFSWGSSSPSVPAYIHGAAVGIAAGADHNAVLQRNGTVRISSYQVTLALGNWTNIIAIASGASHCLALKEDGTVLSWGSNTVGQTSIPAGLGNVVAIAAGRSNSLALKANGQVVAWGDNRAGQTNVPADLANVVAIGAGWDHCLALTADGAVHAWGDTNYGKADIPAGLTNVVALTGGAQHSMALSGDGSIAFTTQPRDLMSTVDNPASFRAGVFGVPPLAYQWQHEGTNLPGATSPVLFISKVKEQDEGSYQLLVTNSNGSAISSNAFLSVFSLTDALDATNLTWTISGPEQWVPTFSSDGRICAAIFPASTNKSRLQTIVEGPGTLTYSLRVGSGARLSFRLNGESEQAAFSSWATIKRYLAAGPHVATWAASMNTYPYGISEAYVDGVSWVPGPIPVKILSQSPSQEFAAGTNATLAVSATGTPPFTYQWSYESEVLSGATSRELTWTNVQAGQAGTYQVIVRNPWGSATSSNIVVSIAPSAPAVVSNPVPMVRMVGGEARFEVSASGSSPLTYQWRKDGSVINAATGSSLIRSNLQLTDGGSYDVEVINALGSKFSSNALLTVLTGADLGTAVNANGQSWSGGTNVPWVPQTNITHDGVSALQSGAILNRQQSVLHTTITGPATVTFWWKVSCDSFWSELGVYVDAAVQGTIAGEVDWQQKSVLVGEGLHTVEWIMSRDAIGGSTADKGWVDEVQVVAGGTPATIVSGPVNQALSAGDSTWLEVTATGTTPLRYQWQFNGSDIAGATNSRLTLLNVQTGTAGLYTVCVTNNYGPAAMATGTVQVAASAPKIGKQPTGSVRALNSTALFQVTARGSEPLRYQWHFNGSPVQGATTSALLLTGLQYSNAGSYWVAVENSYGSVISTNVQLDVISSAVVDMWAFGVVAPLPQPPGVTNVIAVAAGQTHTLALQTDGTVVAWGNNNYGQTNVPAGLADVVAIAAGRYHSVALRQDGTVVAWGDNADAQLLLPPGLVDVVAIAAAELHTLALRRDGTITGWGYGRYGELEVPAGLSNAVDIATGWGSSCALMADGTVRGFTQPAPANLSNVVQVAPSGLYGHALLNNSTVTRWPYGFSSGTPTGVVALVASRDSTSDYPVLLYQNGTAAIPGASGYRFPVFPSLLTNVVAISACYEHAVAVVNDGSPFVSRRLPDQSACTGSRVVFYPGITGYQPMSYQWFHNGDAVDGATNLTLVLANVPATAAGLYHCEASNSLGTVVTAPARLTVIRSAPRLDITADASAGTGEVQLQLSGLSGLGTIVIYSSIDLVDWQPIWTNQPVVGTLQFIDESSTTPQRFYRAVEQ